jgi:hypothetical protein
MLGELTKEEDTLNAKQINSRNKPITEETSECTMSGGFIGN